jgi:hypothetical protein
LEQLFEDKPPAMELPGLGSLDTLAIVDSTNNASTGVDVTPKPDISGEEDEISVEAEDFFANDPPSMTLRDLLLTADASQFELLGM